MKGKEKVRLREGARLCEKEGEGIGQVEGWQNEEIGRGRRR